MRTDRLKIIILLCSLALVLPFLCLTAEGKDFTVVIDPGHGGHDPGAIGRRGKEKNINLNVALKVGRLIQNNCKDVKVIFTRRSRLIHLHPYQFGSPRTQCQRYGNLHPRSPSDRRKPGSRQKGKLCYFNRGQLSATLCRFQSELFGKLHHL